MLAHHTRANVIVALAAVAVTAMAPPTDEAVRQPQLVVQNRGQEMVSVYASGSAGKWVWLGWVEGRTERRFALTSELLEGGLVLTAFPHGRAAGLGESAAGVPGIRSKRLAVEDGAVAVLVIERQLEASLAFVMH